MKLRDSLPELTGATAWLNSNSLYRQDLIGEKPLLIHFWSINCHLCKKSMPYVNELRDTYRERLNIIAVYMPLSRQDTDIEEITRVAKAHNISQPVYIDNDLKLSDRFRTRYVPTYYIFDKNGDLRHFQTDGKISTIRNRINRLIDK
ncbi:TlpA family protein disulfide reductase [Oceanobacillus chungangensis]|uniref:Thiol-disulfide oxidoreductase n=1 Tax=Oceanobacillus chungangensis TaxID=1229152 RepID=A0A3D8PRX6_9BACI|nr:TlpA disulfide reductase family protein [Oceanobacillus chungangensis]RDW18041.1 thiol-disulfide oxidoreductase [Oceanobacillus chungangensis]